MITDRTTATDAEFAARLAAIEAAPWAEESVRERMARAIYEDDVDFAEQWDDEWPNAKRRYRQFADAALGTLRGEGAA